MPPQEQWYPKPLSPAWPWQPLPEQAAAAIPVTSEARPAPVPGEEGQQERQPSCDSTLMPAMNINSRKRQALTRTPADSHITYGNVTGFLVSPREWGQGWAHSCLQPRPRSESELAPSAPMGCLLGAMWWQ